MRKKIVLAFLSVFCISMSSFGIDGWIRINQLGYLPGASKKAILLSESPQIINQFSIHDALTNKLLAEFKTLRSWGEFQSFKSVYILDFSNFKISGAFYIKAGLIFSPTIYINKNIYLGSADHLLNYIFQQRCSNNLDNSNLFQQSDGKSAIVDEYKFIQHTEKIAGNTISNTKSSKTKQNKKTVRVENVDSLKLINIPGGWRDTENLNQNGIISATVIYQLLFAYQMNPVAFHDKRDALGNEIPNGIPDILDEVKWGLDWLMKMYPEKNLMFCQTGDDRDASTTNLLDNKTAGGVKTYRPAYIATGKPQGLFKFKNYSSGIASLAGKYASAFALGSQLLAKYYPSFADSLSTKAFEAFQLGKDNPGFCQTIPAKLPVFLEENNWTDDMELAAIQLYRLTFEGKYLNEAVQYGKMEPISPWLCSDSARYYQWYPFINLGHYVLANVENPRYRKEYLQNMHDGLQRMNLYAINNPFFVGVPMIRNSNNLVAALATQCHLYQTSTNDSTFLDMENGLIDWLFGRNPWGKNMISGLTKNVHTINPFSFENKKNNSSNGGLISGAVSKTTFDRLSEKYIPKQELYNRFQSEWSVFQDNTNITNQTNLDGTASLTYLFSSRQLEGVPDKTADNNQYLFGGIIRTDTLKKQICLIFSGDKYADGAKVILKTLKKLHINAAFFFTGDFYRNSANKNLINRLQKEQHYLGAHSDKFTQYCSWQKRDSLLINKSLFLNDLYANFKAMEKFEISKTQSPFFLPPNECYNDSISNWCKEVGIQLISFTPGTLSISDNSIPEMREKYFSSNEIMTQILQTEKKQGLNGEILMFHIGSDKKRQDKFYPRLNSLLSELMKAGYQFVDLYKATDIFDKNNSLSDTKRKKKN